MDALSFQDRIDALHRTKQEHTAAKQQLGANDNDDLGLILPPDDFHFEAESNHPSGSYFGARACAHNYRRLLDVHPTYIDPMSSLAGAWMYTLWGHRPVNWPPECSFEPLHEAQKRYNIIHGIGGPQHFGPDLQIGLDLGWGGLLEKVRTYKAQNGDGPEEIYSAWEEMIVATQNWIRRHASAARATAAAEERPRLHDDLLKTAEICERLATAPPATFREACQWLAFFEMAARMYNGSGALGALDQILQPYYERDVANGMLDDDEAVFHLACFLLKDPHYSQLGGPDASGTKDMTTRVSFLVLEAIHRMKIPANVAVRVWDGLDEDLLDLAVKYLFEDGINSPLFIGDKGLSEGFAHNGYPLELARQRVKVGCHWCALPGREYTLNDVVKINFVKVFDVALREMTADESAENSTDNLWRRFEDHLRCAVQATAAGIDFHLEHQYKNFPELFLDLFCHGPVENGLDASQPGGVEFLNMCIDGSGLATVADSFAAVEQRVEREGKLSWPELIEVLDRDFDGCEDTRKMLNSTPHYGSGGCRADAFARRLSETFSRLTKEAEGESERKFIPGIFSWASTIAMGRAVGATPNGRHAQAPISFGANPDPGFVKNAAPTAAALAIAEVQPGYGNTAPCHLDLDYTLGIKDEDRAKVKDLIKTHFRLGGTLININILDKDKLLDAEKHPENYPDLIVRVTGFSAYFASLSPTFRRWVIERMLAA